MSHGSKEAKNETRLGRKSSMTEDGGGENSELKGMETRIKDFFTNLPEVIWSDVAGLDAAKETLKEAVTSLFHQDKRQPWRTSLLFGPPGTGKSYLAKAVGTMAIEANSSFLFISSSNLISKWLGDNEKTVQSIFTVARSKKPCVVFFDDIDLICGSSCGDTSEMAQRVKEQFLVQIQGTDMDNDKMLVLGAAHIPWSLDAGVRDRFEKKIYLPLPEAPARTTMFKIHTGKTTTTVTEAEYRQLGEMAEGYSGYSGADINVVVQDALMRPVRKIQTATHYRTCTGPSPVDPSHICDDLLEPCSPGTPGALEMTWRDLSQDKLKLPLLSFTDLCEAISDVKPSVCKEDLRKHEEFLKDFGQGV